MGPYLSTYHLTSSTSTLQLIWYSSEYVWCLSGTMTVCTVPCQPSIDSISMDTGCTIDLRPDPESPWTPMCFLIPSMWALHLSFKICIVLKVTWTHIVTMGVYGDYDLTVITLSHRVVMGWTSNLPDKVFRSLRSYLSHLLPLTSRGLVSIRGQK